MLSQHALHLPEPVRSQAEQVFAEKALAQLTAVHEQRLASLGHELVKRLSDAE